MLDKEILSGYYISPRSYEDSLGKYYLQSKVACLMIHA